MKKLRFKDILGLQVVTFVYSLSSICAKSAAGEDFMSLRFIGIYALEIFILGVYAILWQQVIKKIDLSVAYTNKATVIIWTMLWSVLIFGETLSVKNILGTAIVLCGIVLVNTDSERKGE